MELLIELVKLVTALVVLATALRKYHSTIEDEGHAEEIEDR
jgi:hypothetical protein